MRERDAGNVQRLQHGERTQHARIDFHAAYRDTQMTQLRKCARNVGKSDRPCDDQRS